MKLRRLREGDVLDDGTTLVRGGELEPGVLRADARRYHTVYGSYGISVFAARDATVDEFESPWLSFLGFWGAGGCQPG